jgi:hypothetical protein
MGAGRGSVLVLQCTRVLPGWVGGAGDSVTPVDGLDELHYSSWDFASIIPRE